MEYYIYDFSILAILFMLIICISYFSKRQFPNQQNRVFRLILILSMADVVLDVTSSMLIERAATVPVAIVLINNTLFYALQIIIPVLMLLYVFAMARKWEQNKRLIIVMLAPGIMVETSLIYNFVSQFVFYVDSAGHYTYGPFFNLIYINGCLYILAAFITLALYRKHIDRISLRTMACGLLILTIAIVLQFFFPQHLLIGAGICVSITLMYLIMQKPEDMLDSMTNVFNRHAMFLFFQDRNEERRPCQLITVEIHNLRRINRTFGMTFGNNMLRAVAAVMTESSREDWTFRFMGNIFVHATMNVQEHRRALARIKNALSTPLVVEGVEVSVLSTICDMGTIKTLSIDEIGALIEIMLSEARRGEINTLSEAMQLSFNRRNKVEQVLIEAIENSSLEVYFQPLLALKTGVYERAEALARFRHPTMGFISPSEFIPIAEKQGLIVKVDQLVLRKVCEFIRDNPVLETYGFRTIAINFSPVEFINENLASDVLRTVEEYGVAHDRLLFEITESTVVSEFGALSSNIAMLSEKGFSFILDDYGTGYSNLSVLTRMPFQTVKIDKSMLKASFERQASRIILLNTLRMFSQLGFKTVMEGVEKAEEAIFLAEQGVDYIQGFYYARPMPGEEFLAFLRDQKRLREQTNA